MACLESNANATLNGLSTAVNFTNKTHPFLDRFTSNCFVLSSLAQKELAQQPFDDYQSCFVSNMVEITLWYTGESTYDGWYPGMYYRGAEGAFPPPTDGMAIKDDHDSAKPDRIVSSILNDAPSVYDGDPGAVVYEATGEINWLFIAVDNGPDRIMYAGPVMSHYEFLGPYGVPMTDADWSARVTGDNPPPRPPWTDSFLAPYLVQRIGLGDPWVPQFRPIL